MEVVGVLPGVEDQQWDRAIAKVALVVVDLFNYEARAERLPGQHAPAGALDGIGGLGQLGLEGVEGSKVLVDGAPQRPVGTVAAIGGQVGPEDRVQDVPRHVEGESLFEAYDRGEVALVPRLGQALKSTVGAAYVAG
jgi:hypothetical protein